MAGGCLRPSAFNHVPGVRVRLTAGCKMCKLPETFSPCLSTKEDASLWPLEDFDQTQTPT